MRSLRRRRVASPPAGYVLIAGHLTAETDATELGNVLRRSSRSEVDVKPGDFFGEHTMRRGKREMQGGRCLSSWTLDFKLVGFELDEISSLDSFGPYLT